MEDIQALIEASDYVDDMQKYGYRNTFDEISFSRGRRNYERLLNTLSTLNLPNPETFKYSKLTIQELQQYLLDILTKILGPEYHDQINKYNQMLKLEPITNPFDATLETTYQNGIWVPLNFHVSNKLSSIEVVSIAHEYIHGLLSKYTISGYNEVLSNIHYKEFLSILVEYITCYILSNLIPHDDLEYKQRINRVQAEHLMTLENIETRKLSTILNKLPKSRPDIALYQKYVIYDEHKTYGYIISNIFSYRLLNYYFADERTLLNFIRSIIAGEKSIADLIKYYDLSLSKEDTIKPYNDLIKGLTNK